MRSLVTVLALQLLAHTPTARAQSEPPEPLPVGLWELAASHTSPFELRETHSLGHLLVVSDLATAVAVVRADSGLVAWTRKLPGQDGPVGVWSMPSPEGGLVLAGRDTLQAFRGDVGSRLWERELGCAAGGCQLRVVFAGATPEGDPALYLATGGVVQDQLVRLDPATGKPLWYKAATVQHPRRVLATRDLLVVEDAISPFALRFLDPADGKLLGAWEPRHEAGPRPVSELSLMPDGRMLTVDLRPDNGLALVTLIGRAGAEETQRQVPRAAQITNQPVRAALTDDGLAIFTPDPAGQGAFVTTMLLAAPFTARTEQIKSWGEPLLSGGRWAFAPSVRGPAAQWGAVGTGRWMRQIAGIDPDPARSRTFAVGSRLALVESGEGRAKTTAIATVEARTGRLHGLGAPEIGGGAFEHALTLGEDIVLVRGKSLYRLALVPWNDAVARVRAAKQKGADIQPFLLRLNRFGPPGKAFSDAVRSGGGSSGPDAPPEGAVVPDTLGPEDQAMIAALRETWLTGDPSETLQALQQTVEQTPERSARRMAMLDAVAGLLLDLVLAPGSVPRGDGGDDLVAIARAFEREAAARPPERRTAAIYAGVMALVDDGMTGADVLARVGADPGVPEARLELSRRALHLLRKSAGPLKTDTSRQMLVSGLRFFRHLEELTGSAYAGVNALLDQAVADEGAAHTLQALLIEVEGARATRRGAGPALCQLACEAAAATCGAESRVTVCQDRCSKTGAVRFSAMTRPTADPRWFCR